MITIAPESRNDRHNEFWTWFGGFVKIEAIESMLEIGCGDGANSELVARYTGIDRDVGSVSTGMRKYPGIQLIHGDWLSISEDELRNGYDLVLAAGVVERCPHYREFIKKAVGVGAPWTIITFWHGLDQDCDRMMTREGARPGWSYDNHYSERVLLGWLAENGYGERHEMQTFPSAMRGQEECVLIIRGE